jgi:glycosyltransferase involved in cell wall biosynthesis
VKASLIVACYKDAGALSLVLDGLDRQTEKEFEVIVSEDSQDPQVEHLVIQRQKSSLRLSYLSQEDAGFRKTRAVNRAIAAARTEYLIFLDGDCIPHPKFVEMHMLYAERGRVCAGRRIHLGEVYSSNVRSKVFDVLSLTSWMGLLANVLPLHRDRVRNFEIGAPSAFLHFLFKNRYVSLIGCNFSCYRDDIARINGYDENLVGIGGEDQDLEWRFNAIGVITKSVKFQAVVYHLHHCSRRMNADENVAKSNINRSQNKYACDLGIAQHLGDKS